MFIILFIAAIIAILAGAFYLYRFFGRSFLFFNIENQHLVKWLSISIVMSLLIFAFYNPMGTGTIFFLYFMVFALIFDGIGSIYRRGIRKLKYIYLGGIPAIVITTVIILSGISNGYDVQVTTYEITTDKALPNDALRIAALSDLHVGVTITAENMHDYMVEIENHEPDMVLVVGDLFDERTPIEEVERAIQQLGDIESTYGTYFVWGNHDINGAAGVTRQNSNVALITQLLIENNITILEDEALLIDDSFYLVGRVDPDINRERLTAESVMRGVDTEKPVIIMDHQPLDAEKMAHLGGDLQVSGHTHGGQMYPVGFFAKFIYDHIYGLKTIDDFNLIVSSGLGTWNTPIRLGSISEYIIIDMISAP